MVKPEQVQPASTIEIDNAGEAHNHQPPIKRWLKIVSWVGALLLFLAIYILRLDQVAGLIKDDAWYVLSAKALASGQGYTLINLPSPGTLAFYPPAFPWLLSLVVRFSPQFPQNLWLLKSVSIVAVLGIGIAAYRYFTRERELPPSLALGIAVLTVINPAMAFLATSTVMSECVFTLSQLLTIIVIERYVRAEGSGRAWIYLLSGAALASFTFLTRSVAIGLIAAIVIYLLKERLVRAAVIFAVVVVMCVGPWMLYARRHAPTAAQLIEQNGQNFVYSYTSQFWQKHAGDFTAGTISIGDLPDRIGKNVGLIMGQDIGMMIADLLYRDSRESGQNSSILKEESAFSPSSCLSLAISGYLTVARKKITLAEIVVLLSLIITVIWPWEPFRFILPLLPFMVFYLLMGVGAIYHLSQRWQSPAHPRAPWIAWGMVCRVFVSCQYFRQFDLHLEKKYEELFRAPLIYLILR